MEIYLKYFFENNNSLTAPYHNYFHIQCVIENCYLLAMDENLSEIEIRELIIAALFHDFNHSQGMLPDSKNIEEARFMFLSFSKESHETNAKVLSIIDATEYPYVIPENELTTQQKIIRDADIMQVFEKNFIQQIVFGLLMGENKLSMNDAIDTQLKFMSKIKLYTPMAQMMASEIFKNVIEELNFLKNIIN